MNFRFPILVFCLFGLLVINGILLSKFVQHYFLNAQKELLNKTSEIKFFAESKSSLPKAVIEDMNVRLSDENGFIRLKRSIESPPNESYSANVTNSNSSITGLQKPVPAQENFFTWNLHLNISKYVNSSSPQGATKSAEQTKINHQSSGNYLNLSIHLDGGPNNEDVFDAWTSVGNFIKDLFKTESSKKVSELDQNKEHYIDTKKLNIDEMSQNKDETLGSSSTTSHSELPKISDAVEMEENESASKQKEGKFLFGLLGFGASPQSENPSTEIGVGSGILRSGPDVSNVINASEHFADGSKVGDTDQQSFSERENINLTNAFVFGITEIPSEEKIATENSILVSDIDSFQNLPSPAASVETITSTDISFMVEDIPHEKLCSDCDSKDQVTDHSVTETKSTIMKEMVAEIPHEQLCSDCDSNEEVTDHSVTETKNTIVKEMVAEIPHEKLCSDCDSNEVTDHSVTETKNTIVKEMVAEIPHEKLCSDCDSNEEVTDHSATEIKNTVMKEIVEMPHEKLCSDCDSNEEVTDHSATEIKNTVMKEIVEMPHEKLCSDCDSNDEVTDNSVTVTKSSIMKEMSVFDSNIPQKHEITRPILTEEASLQSEHNISVFGILDKASENIDFVPSSTESNPNTEPHHISAFESKLQISTQDELCADCATDSFQKIIPDNDHDQTAIELNTDGNHVLMQEVFNVNNCSECFASENAQFSSGMENIAAQNTKTDLTEADLEKHCMQLIDVLANARNSITQMSGTNSTGNQLNDSQMELFKYLTNLINFILANQSPSNESITATENATSHELTSNETESNQMRVFPFVLGASRDENSQTESNPADLPEIGTENPNSALLAECDAFIRRKQIKDNNKMFSKPNLMDIISDPNIGVHDFANATISPKLKESQLQFLTDLLIGKKEQSSTAETVSEAPFVVDEPNSHLSNSNNIEGSIEEIVPTESNKVQLKQESTDGETSSESSNSEDNKNRFFLAGILNSIGLGSGERSFNEIENLSNETEFQDISESEISSDKTEISEKNERFLGNFELESRTEKDAGGLHSKIETNTLVVTDEIAADENQGRFLFGLLGLEGSGRDMNRADDLQKETIENKIQLSRTESISPFDCEGDCTEPVGSVERKAQSDVEGLNGVIFGNETFSPVEDIDSECLEDCNSGKILNIQVNVQASSQTSDQNSTSLLDEALSVQDLNNADYICENDTDSSIGSDKNSEAWTEDTIIASRNLKHPDSDSTEMYIENEDARNFKDLAEPSHSKSKTAEIDFPTPVSEDFEGRTSKSINEFSAGVDNFKNDITEDTEKGTNFPDPRLSRRRGRLDDFHEPSLISGREPKRFDVEDVRFLTSPISEDGSWMDPLPKGDFSKAEFQTEQPETLTSVSKVSELHSSTQVSTVIKLLKPFETIRNSTTNLSYRSCKSASECNVFLNERCITVDKRSICDCGRSFFRNEESGVCEAKVLVETSVRLPAEVYSDELSDVNTKRYKKMKEDSIQMMWYLLKENPDILKMVADVDVLGFSPGSLVVHWSIILHPSSNSTLKKIHENVETHLNETLQNEALVQAAPLDFSSAELIPLPMMDPCQNREFNYCSENAICQLTDLEGGYTCECDTNMVDVSVNKNYTGEICEEKCPSNYCGAHGVCQWQNNRRLCLCSSYYFGVKCDSSAVVWVAVSSVLVIIIMVIVNLAMYYCRRIAKRLKRSRSGTSSRRLEEVIAMDEAPVRPQRYADIATPRPPGPEIRVTHASCSSISFDGDSTFDTTHSDVAPPAGTRANATFSY